jgi:Holliday junction resolvase RusA-like endonuclease
MDSATLNRGSVFIPGEPLPTPKKIRGRNTHKVIARDWKERVDPITRRKVRYDIGAMQAWAKKVADAIWAEIEKNPTARLIKKPNGIDLCYLFYVPRPKSVEHELPTVPPDLSNLEYHIENALAGVLYENDSQVVTRSGQKLYADIPAEPGLMLSWQELPNIKRKR